MSDIPDTLLMIWASIQEADQLEAQGKADEAEDVYRNCLKMAVLLNTPLPFDAISHIWLGIGFCYASRQNWTEALAWYHRLEALIFSTPKFSKDPQSEKAKANAQKWVPHLQPGLKVMLDGDTAEEALANLCDSIALAYDNKNEQEKAEAYYQRSYNIYGKLNKPVNQALVCLHQGVGLEHRQEWAKLEQVAQKQYEAAVKAEHQEFMLSAARFLGYAVGNQGRPFKAMEYLAEAILLGRELNASHIKRDEELLKITINAIRPKVLAKKEAQFVELLVDAEKIINSPHYAADAQLLQELTAQEKASPNPDELANFKSTQPIQNLNDAQKILKRFVEKHWGPAEQIEKSSGLAGLVNRITAKKRKVWEITQENITMLEKSKDGQPSSVSTRCLLWTLFGESENTVIQISLKDEVCRILVMEEKYIPLAKQKGFLSVTELKTAADTQSLWQGLHLFIINGVFKKTSQGYVLVIPPEKQVR
jgi:tetratricopeptide (TPR) repeat protein